MAESEQYRHRCDITWAHPSGSSDEFPDIDPSLCHQHPPPATGQIAPFHETSLGKLPGEIRDRIWWYAIAHEYDVILLAVRILWTQKRTNPSPWFWDIIHLVGVCQQMRSEIFHSVHRNITFVHEKVYLGYTTAFFPRSILQCVGVLELTDWGFLCNFFEHDIAKSLSLICDHLPNLIRFQLRATVHKESDVAPTMTRNLLRFGAFLVAKHQNLDLLIWPGDSGETYVRDEEMILFYIDVASSRHFATKRLFRAPAPKYLSERDAENDDISMVEDRLLNATMLRRLRLNDILAHSIDDFTIDRENSTSSEIDEGHDYFAQVDNDSFLTSLQREESGKPYIPVDRLIDICEKRMRKAIDNGTFLTRPAGARPFRGRGRGRGRGHGRGRGRGQGRGRSRGRASATERGGHVGVGAEVDDSAVVHDQGSHAASGAGTRGRGRGRGRSRSRGRGSFRGQANRGSRGSRGSRG